MGPLLYSAASHDKSYGRGVEKLFNLSTILARDASILWDNDSRTYIPTCFKSHNAASIGFFLDVKFYVFQPLRPFTHVGSPPPQNPKAEGWSADIMRGINLLYLTMIVFITFY